MRVLHESKHLTGFLFVLTFCRGMKVFIENTDWHKLLLCFFFVCFFFALVIFFHWNRYFLLLSEGKSPIEICGFHWCKITPCVKIHSTQGRESTAWIGYGTDILLPQQPWTELQKLGKHVWELFLPRQLVTVPDGLSENWYKSDNCCKTRTKGGSKKQDIKNLN